LGLLCVDVKERESEGEAALAWKHCPRKTGESLEGSGHVGQIVIVRGDYGMVLRLSASLAIYKTLTHLRIFDLVGLEIGLGLLSNQVCS